MQIQKISSRYLSHQNGLCGILANTFRSRHAILMRFNTNRLILHSYKTVLKDTEAQILNREEYPSKRRSHETEKH